MIRSKLRKMIGLAMPRPRCGRGRLRSDCLRRKAGRPAQPVTRVEVVARAAYRPAYRRRAGPAPGLRDHADPRQDRRLRQELDVNIGSEIKKGQVLAELYVPEVEADLQEKRAAVEQAQAKKGPGRGRGQSRSGRRRQCRGQGDRGPGRDQAGGSRPRAGSRSTAGSSNCSASGPQTGRLLDETRSKLHSAEASGDEVRAKVKSAEAAVIESRALDKRDPTSSPRRQHRRRQRTPATPRRCWDTPRSRPPTTASSPAATSIPAS